MDQHFLGIDAVLDFYEEQGSLQEARAREQMLQLFWRDLASCIHEPLLGALLRAKGIHVYWEVALRKPLAHIMLYRANIDITQLQVTPLTWEAVTLERDPTPRWAGVTPILAGDLTTYLLRKLSVARLQDEERRRLPALESLRQDQEFFEQMAQKEKDGFPF